MVTLEELVVGSDCLGQIPLDALKKRGTERVNELDIARAGGGQHGSTALLKPERVAGLDGTKRRAFVLRQTTFDGLSALQYEVEIDLLEDDKVVVHGGSFARPGSW